MTKSNQGQQAHHITGLYTALVTPYEDNQVDYGRLEHLVEMQIDAGVDGIVPMGSTGEAATASEKEHMDVVKFVVDQVGGRTHVMAGAGSNSTDEAIRYSVAAAEAGADSLLSVTPYYNKPQQRGLVAHYTAVADSVDIPVVLYNIPGRSVVQIATDTILELSQHPNIVGVKDASSDFKSMEKVIANTPSNFSVLSGNDDETLKIIALGGQGAIAVTSNILPAQMKMYVDLCMHASNSKNLSDWRTPLDMQYAFRNLFADLFIETNPVPVKDLMAYAGLCNADVRLPLVGLEDKNHDQLIQTFDVTKRRLGLG